MEAEAEVMHFEDRNGATSQGVQVVPRSWKRQVDSPLESPGEIRP